MNTFSFKSNIKYGLYSGILFALSWNAYLPAVSLFVAFIPLLYIQNSSKLSTSEFFQVSLFAFFIFHLATVWWIYKSSVASFMVVILLNSLFMASIMALYSFVFSKLGRFWANISFVAFWLVFEYFHYHWEVSWPFMNLGNWMGQSTKWIQWYEYTGVLGGTLWILLLNILFFETGILLHSKKYRAAMVSAIITTTLIIAPLFFSYKLLNKVHITGEKIPALIIQTNIEPYTEKYDASLFVGQINEQIATASKNNSEQTQLIIFPEASFPLFLNQDSILFNKDILQIKKLTGKNTSVIAGLYTFQLLDKDTLFFNTAVCLNKKSTYVLHNKSKLVPAVEKTPFADYFRFLSNWNVNFGGITSSLGSSNKQTIFKTGQTYIAPIICYESVFGEYVAQFVKNGAEIITVITNDAWWGNTAAYEQILMHSQLRAIESRRTIVRSANKGISCLIDKFGTIRKVLPKNKKAVLAVSAEKNNKITFYVQHGDFIGRFSLYVSGLILLILGFQRVLFRGPRLEKKPTK